MWHSNNYNNTAIIMREHGVKIVCMQCIPKLCLKPSLSSSLTANCFSRVYESVFWYSSSPVNCFSHVSDPVSAGNCSATVGTFNLQLCCHMHCCIQTNTKVFCADVIVVFSSLSVHRYITHKLGGLWCWTRTCKVLCNKAVSSTNESKSVYP